MVPESGGALVNRAFKDIVDRVGKDFVWHTPEGDLPGRGLASVLESRINAFNENNPRSGRLALNVGQATLLVLESDLKGKTGQAVTVEGKRYVTDFQGSRDGVMHIHLKPEAKATGWR